MIFSLIVTLAYIFMLFISALLGALWPGEELYGQPGSIVGRVLSSAILTLALHRLGWLRPAGFESPGRWRTWLVLVPALAYAIAVSVYSMTGRFELNFSSPALPGMATLFILTQVFMEEVAFRGLILYALVRTWGSTNRGLIQSVLVASLFFGSFHLLDVLSGRPLTNVVLQSLQACFLGIFLATVVLVGKSIYPAVFFHFVLNLAGYLSFGRAGLEPEPSSWLSLSLLMLPPALISLYYLRGVYYRPVVPEAA